MICVKRVASHRWALTGTEPDPAQALTSPDPDHDAHLDHDRDPTVQALRNFKILRAATAAAAGALLLALATVLGRGAPLQSRLVVGLVVGAALCGKAWRSASDWVEKFYYVPFVHQDRP